MAKGGVKGPPGGGESGGSGFLFVTGTAASEVLVGDLFFPDNETVGYEIIGAGGNDVLTGGANDDRLNGQEDFDVYFGAGGNDLLLVDPSDFSSDIGGALDGANTLLDAFLVDEGLTLADLGLTDDGLIAIIDGGDDTADRSGDTVATSDAGDTVLVDLANYVNLETGEIGTIDETGTIIGDFATVINVENVIVRGADHTIVGNNDPNHIVAGSGNDHVTGLGGNDFLDGANDDDILIGGAGDDHYRGGRGSDLFIVGLGDDVIFDFDEDKDSVQLDPDIGGGVLSVVDISDGDDLGRANRADTTLEISVDGTLVGTVTFVDATVGTDIFSVS